MADNRRTAKVVALKTPPCPICGRPAERDTRPFCSRRCADLDLGAWVSEEYRIPVDPEDAEDDQEEPD